MNVLVTGSKGFVGSNISELLEDLGINVYRNDSVGLKSRSDKNDVKLDAIIHCAAKVKSDEESNRINRYIDDVIIETCKTLDTKLIYLSTTSIYGHNIKEEVHPFYCDTTPYPNPYIIEKLNTEKAILQNLQKFVILRVSSPYGPGQKQKNIINKFISRAIKGKDLYVLSNGVRKQDFIYIEDLCRLILNTVILKEKTGIYHATFGESISMLDLASTISGVFKVHVHNTLLEDSQVGLQGNFVNEKTIVDFSWKPVIDIEEGIDRIARSL